nr:unnamed protein product [Callosobruchus analis]
MLLQDGQVPPMTTQFSITVWLGANLSKGIFQIVFLGDSGYAQKRYMLTPLANPITRGQTLYNEAHIRTRNVVERTIGIWKRRFPVLAYGLRLKLETVLAIIPAAAVLHNIAKNMHEPEPPTPFELSHEELQYLTQMGQIPDVPMNNDLMFQRDLVDNYFSNL